MPSPLPPFQPVTEVELRELWAAHSDSDIRRVVLEVVRYRRVIKEIDDLYKNTHKAWQDQVGGNLVALHMLQGVMLKEHMRIP